MSRTKLRRNYKNRGLEHEITRLYTAGTKTEEIRGQTAKRKGLKLILLNCGGLICKNWKM
jgi:hypothetical protein